MTDPDIVDRLRRYFVTERNQWNAADEIERLRKECFHLAANQCHAGYGGEYGHHRCAEIDRLTKERDEARRELCRSEAIIRLQRNRAHRDSEEVVRMAKEIAVERGWDCFKENS